MVGGDTITSTFHFLIFNCLSNQQTVGLPRKVDTFLRSDHKGFCCNLGFKLIFNIRSTWGRPLIPNVKTRLAFLLGENIKNDRETSEKNISGSTEVSELQKEIERENSEHHDIIQGDFVDTYRNLSYKNIMGKLWVSEFCKQVSFLTIC